MDAVTISGDTILTSAVAVVDTGTRFIIGDWYSVAAFYEHIPGAEGMNDGFYIGASMTFILSTQWFTLFLVPVPCDGLPLMSLTFGGKIYSIDPSTFIIGHMADTPRCLASLIGVRGMPPGKSYVEPSHTSSVADRMISGTWVVGGAFLTNVYTVFDLGRARVGFAQLK
jgi:hypothetical protein